MGSSLLTYKAMAMMVFLLACMQCHGSEPQRVTHSEYNSTTQADGQWNTYGSKLATVHLQDNSVHRERSRKLLPTFKELAVWSRTIRVDLHGRGQFKSVQAAVNSVPINNRQWVYIQVGPGVYYEKVTIPYNKPFIALQGAGRSTTVISWKDRASSLGTANSATFSATAPSFIAKGIGFRNAAPPPSPGAYGGQAVAVLLNGDMMAFYDCGFYGAQDTLFDYEGRHYFKNCYIQGSIDFIFGHGQSFFKFGRLHFQGRLIVPFCRDPSDGAGLECRNGARPPEAPHVKKRRPMEYCQSLIPLYSS